MREPEGDWLCKLHGSSKEQDKETSPKPANEDQLEDQVNLAKPLKDLPKESSQMVADGTSQLDLNKDESQIKESPSQKAS